VSVKAHYRNLTRMENDAEIASNSARPPAIGTASAAHFQVDKTRANTLAVPVRFSHSAALRTGRKNNVSAVREQSTAKGVRADLEIPANGRISSSFNARLGHGHRHKGIDIAASDGAPVRAAADGEVVFAGHQHGYGNTVLIKHDNGRMTRYAHADRLMTAPGRRVRAGEQIATLGNGAQSHGATLHFEVIDRGVRVDPMKALRGVTNNGTDHNRYGARTTRKG
jgi:murein DD-endopeptidase MepM/ murein hydrolase activator NlpD